VVVLIAAVVWSALQGCLLVGTRTAALVVRRASMRCTPTPRSRPSTSPSRTRQHGAEAAFEQHCRVGIRCMACILIIADSAMVGVVTVVLAGSGWPCSDAVADHCRLRALPGTANGILFPHEPFGWGAPQHCVTSAGHCMAGDTAK